MLRSVDGYRNTLMEKNETSEMERGRRNKGREGGREVGREGRGEGGVGEESDEVGKKGYLREGVGGGREGGEEGGVREEGYLSTLSEYLMVVWDLREMFACK